MSTDTWPRPPTDYINDHLEDFFPVHKFDTDGRPLPNAYSEKEGLVPFQWIRGELIGKGSIGRVYVSRKTLNGSLLAIKWIENSERPMIPGGTRLADIAAALKVRSELLRQSPTHPHVIQYYGFEETPNHLTLVCEYVPGTSLSGLLAATGKFHENTTKFCARQILSGLDYLHQQGLIQEKLCAKNVLIEHSGTCKISYLDGPSSVHTESIFWMAPEAINPPAQGFNAKVDIWSFGCVIIEMWTGKRPWGDEQLDAVLAKLLNRTSPPIPEEYTASDMASNFISRAFHADPDLRTTASEMLQHSYLQLPEDWTFPESPEI